MKVKKRAVVPQAPLLFYFPALILTNYLLPLPPGYPGTNQNHNTAQQCQIWQKDVKSAGENFIGVMISPEFQLVSNTPEKKRQT
ncbi:hypothetical protein [Escherichia coli]|uniref:hypothetical protein n=1 Tax=Escherichia coli TaxID=562 RepID=UPI0019187E6C|nr:hypothetical protein [Escherichia coli]